MTPKSLPEFQPLMGIYEPSAIQQLPDGRFLIVEDEKQHPFSLVTFHPDGSLTSLSLSPGLLESGETFWALDDLEGLALDRSGNIYAITSHSRDGDGDEKKSRDRLVRFRIEGERIVESRLATGVKHALRAAHPVLAAATEILDVKSDGGLNVEALEYSMDQQCLLIGFRSPLLDNRAIIASLENPSAMFEVGEPPRISRRLITLDLDGSGIRGLSYLPSLNGYLVISGPVSRQQAQFQLWFWRGQPDERVHHVSVAGLEGFEHAEGVSPAVLDGCQRIIVVSDDGSRKEGRPAHYLMLDPEQLRIAP